MLNYPYPGSLSGSVVAYSMNLALLMHQHQKAYDIWEEFFDFKEFILLIIHALTLFRFCMLMGKLGKLRCERLRKHGRSLDMVKGIKTVDPWDLLWMHTTIPLE